MSYALLLQLVEYVNANLPAGYSLRYWIPDFDDAGIPDADANMKAHYRRWLKANDPDVGQIPADGSDDASRHILFVLKHVSGARVIRVVTIQQVRNLIANNPTLAEKRQALRTVILNWKAIVDSRIPGGG